MKAKSGARDLNRNAELTVEMAAATAAKTTGQEEIEHEGETKQKSSIWFFALWFGIPFLLLVAVGFAMGD